jgi:hypothetical protein
MSQMVKVILEENMTELRRHIHQNASSLGVDKEIAGVIADSFIGKLIMMGEFNE